MGLLLLVIFALFIIGVYRYFRQKRDQEKNSTSSLQNHTSGGVIVLVIDSLMDKPLQDAIKNNKAPALNYLIEKGQYFPNVVSSFPTMSVTIDTSLLTGTYPDQHKIPGLVWYDKKNNNLISYGSAWQEILMLGVKNVLNNALYHLNNSHISPDVRTIHEELAQNGEQSASVNALVYRGSTSKQLRPPRLATFFKLLPHEIHIKGTSLFSFGSLSQLNPKNRYGHLWQAYGLNDKFSTSEMIHLIKNGKLPKFTIAYFPVNDKDVHKKGPKTTVGIEKVDHEVQKLLNTYGSWDEALKENVWIVMGDSGQARIGNDKHALIDLPLLLKNYRIPTLSKSVQHDDQIVLGLNERMAYVYLLDNHLDSTSIATLLKKDQRIGFVAWRKGEDIHVASSEYETVFSFRNGGQYIDQYGQSWSLEGETPILDITINEEKRIFYGNYPDPLARLLAVFRSHEGRFLVVDAKPGFEFVRSGSPNYKGGAAHGSLHADDSLVPMIVTGTNTRPEHLRIVDLKKWIMQLMKTR